MTQAELGINHSTKRARKREFLDEVIRVAPWSARVALVTPRAPAGRRAVPSFPIESVLRIHFIQQWYGWSVSAMKEALFHAPPYREFGTLNLCLDTHRGLNKTTMLAAQIDEIERVKARILGKVALPFWVIKRQFRVTKVRYRGLKKNIAQTQ